MASACATRASRRAVALHAVRQICGLPAQDGIEPEQHDRRERIEQLGSADPEPGCEVDQAAPIEQEHPPTVELKALEMSSNWSARMTVEPVDVDFSIAVADVDEDRAVGDLRQLLLTQHAVEPSGSDDHAR